MGRCLEGLEGTWRGPGRSGVVGDGRRDWKRSQEAWRGLERPGGVRGDLERSGMEEGSEEVGKRAGDGGLGSSTWVMMGRDSLTKEINGKNSLHGAGGASLCARPVRPGSADVWTVCEEGPRPPSSPERA